MLLFAFDSLDIFRDFFQMLTQRTIRAEGCEESVFLRALLLEALNMILDALVGQNHTVFLREFFKLHHQLGRVGNIHDEDSEEHSDEEGKCKIMGKRFDKS